MKKVMYLVLILGGISLESCMMESDFSVDDQVITEFDRDNLQFARKGDRPKGGNTPLLLSLLPGAQSGSARGINNNGEIVGYSYVASHRHPTYWSSSSASPEDLGFPDGISYAYASSISDQGHIVGSTGEIQSNSTAIQFRPGSPKKLEHLLGAGLAYAWEVNASGLISGSANDTPSKMNYAWGVYWEDGLINDIGSGQGGNWTVAYGLNDAGVIVGYSLASDGRNIPFYWNNGSFTELPYLGQGFGLQKAYDINNNGDIVGASRDDSGAIHPVMWKDGELVDYGIFPGNINGGWAEILAVNENGEGVGWGWGLDGRKHALLFKDGDITQLAEPQDAYTTIAFDINDAGQIVGETYFFDGTTYQTQPAFWTTGGGGGSKGGGKRK